MKKIFLIFCVCILSAVGISCATAGEQIDSYRHLMDNKTYSIITKQHKAYETGKLPKIADNVIKTIPIRECGEKLIDIRKDPHNPRILMKAATGGSKMRITLYKKLEKTLTNLDKLAPHFGFKSKNIDIRVYDAFRDLQRQQQIFDDMARKIRLKNPGMSEEKVIAETSTWVSPVKGNTPVHSTGGAVDFVLWNKATKSYIDLGSIQMTKGTKSSTPTFSKYATKKQMKNRLFLLIAATQAGLINYPYEFWHFSIGDRYAAYFTGAAAIYNTVK